MGNKICLINIYEKCSRISTDFILEDFCGEFNRVNNWTFDILSKELFKAIFKQIMNHELICKCYIALPNAPCLTDSDSIKVDINTVIELEEETGVKIEFVKDVFNMNGKSKDNAIKKIYKVVS